MSSKPSTSVPASSSTVSSVVQSQLFINLTLSALKIWTHVYDMLTWPFYAYFQSGSTALNSPSGFAIGDDATTQHRMAQPIIEGNVAMPWKRNEAYENKVEHGMVELPTNLVTLETLFSRVFQMYPEIDALGTREIVTEEFETQPNGKSFKKLTLGDYKWETFSTVEQRAREFGLGLVECGMQPGSGAKLVIYAETRAEWFIAAQACFAYNFPVVTLYSSLSVEAIRFGIQHSEAEFIITTEELLPKLMQALPDCPQIRHVIFMNHAVFYESQRSKAEKLRAEFAPRMPRQVRLLEMSEVEEIGRDRAGVQPENREDWQAKPQDVAIIMYTSGSTGLPKGVEMTNKNLVTAIRGFVRSLPVISQERDIYIGYLPLAHVMELLSEMFVLCQGVRIGYSSPLTLTDSSNKIKAGSRGDISVLRPTLLVTVPTILDRISKTVWEKVHDAGPFFEALFNFAFEYKSARQSKGFQSVFMDLLVFKKIRKMLGGRIRFILSGGAPLRPEAQRFVNAVICPMVQGYGLTETCACGALQLHGDMRLSTGGPPPSGCLLRLRDWPEGGYSVHAKPNPRGEILIGGDLVTHGYYKNPEKTAEDFFEDEETGVRWFCTGDIGELEPCGSLRVIDRKKDIVKLQGGEYLSLSKIELIISTLTFVDMVCIYAESDQDFCVALISPKQKQFLELAASQTPPIELSPSDNPSSAAASSSVSSEEDEAKEQLRQRFIALCRNDAMKRLVLQHVQQQCRREGLGAFETPQKLFLDANAWTPDTGLVTDSMKLKRVPLRDAFRAEIDELYSK